MSLINQMLKDLEARSRTVSRPDIVLSGLQTMAETNNYKKIFLFFLAGICFFSFTLYVITHHKIFDHFRNQKSLPHYVISQPIEAAKLTDYSLLNKYTPPAVLTGITLQTQEDTTYLRFLLSQSVLYKLSTDLDNRQLIIELEHARLTTTLPLINYTNTAVQDIRVENERSGDLKIILTMVSRSELQHLELNQAGKLPELQLDIYRNNLSGSAAMIPAENESMPKKPLAEKAIATDLPVSAVKKLVYDTTAEDQYERAMSLSSIGQANKAILLLSNIVNQYPSFTPARQSLVGLLLQAGNLQQAKKSLMVGLDQQPGFVPFIDLKARILVAEKKLAIALEVLEQVSPAIGTNQDHYAFIAALYQQQGNAKMAANLYEQLLQIQPTKAVWWMGLGIALDSMGKNSEATEAYARANNYEGLDPESKAYVESRI